MGDLRFAICIWMAVALGLVGCTQQRTTPGTPSPDPASHERHHDASTTQPVLYHRTGGIAGTDDRVVIWPDGFVQVVGRILTPATGRLPGERLERLRLMFARWDELKDSYQDARVADAYTITIRYGGKTVAADDIAPDLPEQFRRIFTEVESIAASAASSDTSARPTPTLPAVPAP